MRELHRCVNVVNFEVSWYILFCALSICGIFLHKLYAGLSGKEKGERKGQPGGKGPLRGEVLLLNEKDCGISGRISLEFSFKTTSITQFRRQSALTVLTTWR